MIAKRDFENEKRPPTGVESPVCGRREDHLVQIIRAGRFRQTRPQWTDSQWDVFSKLPPSMWDAYTGSGCYKCRVRGVGEILFTEWDWASDDGHWIRLSTHSRSIDVRPEDVRAVTVRY